MSQQIIKLADRLAGSILVSVLGASKHVQKVPLKSILIIRPGGIGDAVLLASAINCLKMAVPHLSITVLAEQRNSGAFSMMPGVAQVLCYDRLREFLRALRGNYDVVVDTEQWYRLSAVVARIVRAPMKIGFGTNERRRMFTHCIDYDTAIYEPDNFDSLLKPLGVDCQQEVGAVTLTVPLLSVAKADQLLKSLRTDLFIAIFPGASTSEKRWGAERFRRVAELLSAIGIKIVVVGGKEDKQQGEGSAGGGGEILNLAGMTSLAETAAVIQKSALLLSGDSGVLHIAVGLGVPTVSLFGPGRSKKWAPRGEHHIVINRELPCSPCTTFGTTPPCPINVQCMRDITVDEVFNAVTMLAATLARDTGTD